MHTQAAGDVSPPPLLDAPPASPRLVAQRQAVWARLDGTETAACGSRVGGSRGGAPEGDHRPLAGTRKAARGQTGRAVHATSLSGARTAAGRIRRRRGGGAAGNGSAGATRTTPRPSPPVGRRYVPLQRARRDGERPARSRGGTVYSNRLAVSTYCGLLLQLRAGWRTHRTNTGVQPPTLTESVDSVYKFRHVHKPQSARPKPSYFFKYTLFLETEL